MGNSSSKTLPTFRNRHNEWVGKINLFALATIKWQCQKCGYSTSMGSQLSAPSNGSCKACNNCVWVKLGRKIS